MFGHAPAQARRAHAPPRRRAPERAAERAASWSRTRWRTRRRRARLGMRTVWMQRYLGGRFRGASRDRINTARSRAKLAFDACPKPAYVYARISVAPAR